MKLITLPQNRAKLAKALGFAGLVGSTAAAVLLNEMPVSTAIMTVFFGATSGNVIGTVGEHGAA